MSRKIKSDDPFRPKRALFRPSSWLSKPARDFGSESGAVAIETAFSVMLIMTLVLGIIECSVMMYTYSVLGDAARHGVRYAIIHGASSSNCSGPSTGCADSSATNVVNDVTTYANIFANNISGMTVQVTYPDVGGSTSPSRVTVAITYTYQSMFHVLGTGPVFHISSQGRILY
jgi:Flp pilus assembly protein TadG